MALGMEQPRSNLIEVLKAERAREKELKRREKLTPEELQTLFAKELVQLEEKSPGFTKLAVGVWERIPRLVSLKDTMQSWSEDFWWLYDLDNEHSPESNFALQVAEFCRDFDAEAAERTALMHQVMGEWQRLGTDRLKEYAAYRSKDFMEAGGDTSRWVSLLYRERLADTIQNGPQGEVEQIYAELQKLTPTGLDLSIQEYRSAEAKAQKEQRKEKRRRHLEKAKSQRGGYGLESFVYKGILEKITKKFGRDLKWEQEIEALAPEVLEKLVEKWAPTILTKMREYGYVGAEGISKTDLDEVLDEFPEFWEGL